jgi:predicted GNAT family N-acyltransferase
LERVSEFPVVLLFFIQEGGLRARVESCLDFLTRSCHPFGLAHEEIRFSAVFAGTEEEVGSRVLEVLFGGGKAHLIVASDRLVRPLSPGSYGTTRLSDVILEAFFAHRRLCSLVALSRADLPMVCGITASVDARELSAEALRSVLVKAATRLHLLSPPSKLHGDLRGQADVRVQLVQGPEDLRRCFALRHRVYGAAGYLDRETEGDPSGLELDYYDGSAIHFMASDPASGETIATLRLIFVHKPRGALDSVIGPAAEVFERHRSLFKEVVDAFGPGDYRRRLTHPGAAALPILQSLRLNEDWRGLLRDVSSGVEVSRNIVSPEYRGLGVSTLLMRLAICTACDLGRGLVFAECQPTHVDMYRKAGFKAIEGDEGRTRISDYYQLTGRGIFADLREGMREPIVHVARGDLSLVKMANARLGASGSLDFTVRLGQYRLGPP